MDKPTVQVQLQYLDGKVINFSVDAEAAVNASCVICDGETFNYTHCRNSTVAPDVIVFQQLGKPLDLTGLDPLDGL